MFLQQLINGITIGSTYALIAIGFSLIFSVLRLINLANGSMYMIGAYATLFFISTLGTVAAIAAIIIALILSGILGFVIEKTAIHGLRKKNAPKLSYLISTMGMAIALDNAVIIIFGAESKAFPNLIDFGKFYIGDAIISSTQLIILAVGIILVTALSLIVYKTRIGMSMRATAQNPEASKLMGVNIGSVISGAFVICGILACISGMLYGMYYQSLDVGMGARVGIKVFAAAILGGVGSLPGAVVGGFTIGILETLVAGYISSGYRDSIAFIVLILVLLLRPSGFFGQKEINKV